MRWLVVGVVAAVGCGPAPRRAAPTPVTLSSAHPDAIPAPAPADAAEPPPTTPPLTPTPLATPTAAPPGAAPPGAAPSPVVIAGSDCRGTRGDLDACQAMGPQCWLSAPPELPRPDRCANRGARCLDDLEPKPARAAPCWCTCSDRYRAAQRAADAEADRLRALRDAADCRQELDVRTGKPTGVCAPRPLPR